MERLCAAFAGLLLVPAAAAADGIRSDCTGEIYSYAEMAPPGAREPLIAVPETLCADLANSGTTRIDSLNIYFDGRGNPRSGGNPSWRHMAPQRRY
jgi:hypothetical protein